MPFTPTAAQVRHENGVQVYEVGKRPLPYIAMEFIPGETLQQRLDRTGPVDVVELVRIGRQIAEGLVTAHATDLGALKLLDSRHVCLVTARGQWFVPGSARFF